MDNYVVIAMIVGFIVVAVLLLNKSKDRVFGPPSKTREGGGEDKGQDHTA